MTGHCQSSCRPLATSQCEFFLQPKIDNTITYLYCEDNEDRCQGRCVPKGQCSCEPSKNECTVGNPVLPSTGDKLETVVDFTTGGAEPLSVVRTYNSSRNWMSSIGNGWSLEWDRRLVVGTSGNIRIYYPDGSSLELRKASASSNNYLPLIQSAWNVTGVKILSPVSAYEITSEDDTVERFELIGAEWKLKTISKRAGYQQTIAYDSDGLLIGVSDSFGRSLAFTTEVAIPAPSPQSGRMVTNITGPDGIQINYSYSRRQTTSGSPMYTTAVLENVIVSNPTGFPSIEEQTSYHYEDSAKPYLLTGITNGLGVRYATFVYDSYNRVTSSAHVDANDVTSFAYDVT